MKIQNRQERSRTRDYSVNENALIGKIYKWSEKELKRLPARPEVKKSMKFSKMRAAELNAEKVQKYFSNSYPSISFLSHS